MKLALLVLCLIATWCSYDISSEDHKKTLKCTDTRDGETFEYKAETITNAGF